MDEPMDVEAAEAELKAAIEELSALLTALMKLGEVDEPEGRDILRRAIEVLKLGAELHDNEATTGAVHATTEIVRAISTDVREELLACGLKLWEPKKITLQ